MIFKILLRVVLLAAALVFFASLLVVAFVLLAFWLARGLWAKAMGRPVAPWHFRFDPQARWRGFQASAASAQATRQRASARVVADITDVVVKDIKPADGAAQH